MLNYIEHAAAIVQKTFREKLDTYEFHVSSSFLSVELTLIVWKHILSKLYKRSAKMTLLSSKSKGAPEIFLAKLQLSWYNYML